VQSSNIKRIAITQHQPVFKLHQVQLPVGSPPLLTSGTLCVILNNAQFQMNMMGDD